MKPRSIHLLVLAVGLAAGLSGSAENYPTAPPPSDHPWCATGKATDQRVANLDRWVRARDARLAKQGKVVAAPESRIENDIILMDSTPSSLPFHHPLDLEGSSLVFVPIGTDDYTVSRTPLDYDDDVGASVHTFEVSGGNSWHFRTVDLDAFTFPLGGVDHSRLYVTAHNGIHFSTPALGLADQYNLLDAISLDEAVVSPLLHTDQGTIFPLPELFVKQGADTVTITWRSGPSEYGFALDIQARLEASGRIVFSYRTVDEFAWGLVVVTTGSESWRAERDRLFTSGTPAAGTTGTVAQMLDLRSVAIDRVGDSNLLELTATVTANLRPELLPSGRYLGYWVQFTDATGAGDWVMLYITSSEVQYRTPDAGWNPNSPAAEFTGNTIRMRFFQETLNLASPLATVSVATLNADGEPAVDSMSGSVPFDQWSREFGSDLSTVTAASLSMPVIEPFVLGELNPGEVWSQVRAAYGLTNEQVDAVAIYQDFYTNLILYAGAYSTVGNPQADGVANRAGYGTQHPESPALLHMNRVGYRWNADLPRSFHVTSHEFGHRWLYFIDFDKGTGPSNALRPLGGHPAQYVHTPAAFSVYTGRDSSTMGGSNFSDHGNGSFSTPDVYGYYGYSWHDLYLMGLAAPDEVEDWYYIENTSPRLGGAYYPPPETTVTGTRRNVAIDDVIRAMGPRSPTVATSQKRFRVVYVLLSTPGTGPSQEALQELNEQRQWFERMFRVATGHRGEVDTTLVPVRRRGVRLSE